MNIFGIGLPEMAVIAAIGLLVFGPKRLPELGKTLGRTLRGFQSASQEFEKEFRSAVGGDPSEERPAHERPAPMTAPAEAAAPGLAALEAASQAAPPDPAAVTVTTARTPLAADPEGAGASG